MIRRLLPRLFGAASLIALAVLVMPAMSRPEAEDEGTPLGKVSPDLALVPRDAFYFVSARPADLADVPAFKAAFLLPPLDKGIEAMKAGWGMAPDGLERVTIFARNMLFDQGNPALFIFRAKKDLDKDAIKKSLRFDSTTVVHGKTIDHGRDFRWGPSAWFADDKTFVLGSVQALVPYLATLAKPGKNHLLAEELKIADGTHSMTAALLPQVLMRHIEASDRIRQERWKKEREEMRKDRRFRDKDRPFIPKDEKFGARREERREFVAFQREDRAPDIADLKEPDLKLKSFTDAVEAMQGDYRGELLGFWLSVLRANRAVATLDVDKKTNELKMAIKGVFPSEADAKDGQAAVDFGRISARELATLGPKFRKEAKAIADLLKPVASGFADAEVKREEKIVTAEVKVKPDLAAAIKTVIENGPDFFFGRPVEKGFKDKGPPRKEGKFDDKPRFLDKDKK